MDDQGRISAASATEAAPAFPALSENQQNAPPP